MNRIDGIGLELIEKVANNECDLRGRLTVANVFKKMTEIAGINAEQLGFGFQKMLDLKLYWVLSRMKIRFFRPAFGGEKLYWRSWPKGFQQKLFFIRDFEVLDENRQQIMLASSAWLVIHATERRLMPPTQLPDIQLPVLENHIALDEPLNKISVSNTKETLTVKANYSNLDLLGHMNNARYVEAISDALPYELMTEGQMEWIQVNFDKEVRPQEQLSVRVAPEPDNLWGIEGLNLSNNQPAFSAHVKFAA